MGREIRFVARWVALSALGMSAGVLVAGQLIALSLWQWSELRSIPAGLALLLTLLLAGAGHGAAMGAAQSVLLRSRTGVDRTRWILTTMVFAAIAWALVGTINLVAGDPWDASERLKAIFLGGLALGALLGAGQWLVLRRHLTDSFAWIPANSLAWVAGTGLGVLALDLFPADPTPLELAVAIGLGTLVPGAAIGTITGLTLLALFHPVVKRPAG